MRRWLIFCGLMACLYALFRWNWMLGLGLALAFITLFVRAWRQLKAARLRGDLASYRSGSPSLDWALALAHPMAYHSIRGGFAESQLWGADDALAAQLRPMLLHHLGLRTDLAEARIEQQLPGQLQQRWFALDLQKLHPADDPRAALAFACARVAFYVRCAYLLGWIEAGLQEQLLRLNACRAQACFASWLDYGQAYAAGRAAWIAQGRADVLGPTVTADEVLAWTANPEHPWGAMDWRLPLLDEPPAKQVAALESVST